MKILNTLWDKEVAVNYAEKIFKNEDGSLIDIPELLQVSIDDLYTINEKNYQKWIDKVEKKIELLDQSTENLKAAVAKETHEIERNQLLEVIKENQKLKNSYRKIEWIFYDMSLFYTYIRKYIEKLVAEKEAKEKSLMEDANNTMLLQQEVPQEKDLEEQMPQESQETSSSGGQYELEDDMLKWLPIGEEKKIEQPSNIIQFNATVAQRENKKSKIELPQAKETTIEEEPKEEDVLKWMPIGKVKPREKNDNPVNQAHFYTLESPEPKLARIEELKNMKARLEEQQFPNIAIINQAIHKIVEKLANNPQNLELRKNYELMTMTKKNYLTQNQKKLMKNPEYQNIIRELDLLKSPREKEVEITEIRKAR